jgi:hypothetical protein
VQPHHGRLPWPVVNRHDIEPAGTFRCSTLGKKSLLRPNHDALLFSRYGKFRQRRQVSFYCAPSDSHERQRLLIVTDEIDFASDAA